jgi:hypothetical protein
MRRALRRFFVPMFPKRHHKLRTRHSRTLPRPCAELDRNAIVLANTPSTATGWVKAAGGDWNRYIAYVADRSRATTNPTARRGASR